MNELQLAKKKNITIYIALIVGPFIALIASALLQIMVRFMFNGSGNGGITAVINIFSFLIGIVSVIAILLLPLWILLLIQATQHNKSLTATPTHPPKTMEGPPNRPQ